MGKQRHTSEQNITKLREAEVSTSRGMTVEEVLRQLGVSDATYYKWREESGGLGEKEAHSESNGTIGICSSAETRQMLQQKVSIYDGHILAVRKHPKGFLQIQALLTSEYDKRSILPS